MASIFQQPHLISRTEKIQRVWTSKSISPLGPAPDRRPPGEGVAGGGEGVVEDLEDADEAEAHAEAEEAAGVGHETAHEEGMFNEESGW